MTERMFSKNLVNTKVINQSNDPNAPNASYPNRPEPAKDFLGMIGRMIPKGASSSGSNSGSMREPNPIALIDISVSQEISRIDTYFANIGGIQTENMPLSAKPSVPEVKGLGFISDVIHKVFSAGNRGVNQGKGQGYNQ